MAEKNLSNIRIVNKHDIEENWLKATGFTPKQGELIVYDIDENYNYERIKIGDGVQNVNDLPFYASSWNDLTDKPFGSIEGQDYIVEEQSIVLGNAMGGTETYVSTTRPFSEFIEDQVYYIVFDGEVYPAEYDSDLDGLSVDAVDLEIYYGGNDEITVFTVYSDPRKGETHTFGMYVTEIVTAQLDEKYIPDTIARISDIPITNTSLSVAGAPADAKATGDAIREISTLVGDKSVSEQINTAAVNNQSDWSVNDETSTAYVKNRTHWVETERVALIDNETVYFEPSDNAHITQIFDERIVLVDGNTYEFVIDGISYSCVAYTHNGQCCIGNLSIGDPSLANTNEPFIMTVVGGIATFSVGGSSALIFTTLEGDSHTISLFGDVSTYHKIDKNYLPEMIGKSGSAEGAEIFNDYINNEASGVYSHVEGSFTTASGESSHAEGNGTTASNECSHAEGSNTTASGIYSHAEGRSTVASGDYGSHAEGTKTTAAGNYSHSEGWQTTANSESQHVQGEWNIIDTTGAKNLRGTYAHIVGNGTSNTARSNAHTVAWDGTGWFKGAVKIGGTGQDDETAKELATQEYVDTAISTSTAASADKLTNPVTIDGVKFDGSTYITHYGSCDTDGATNIKVVALSNFSLHTGSRVIVKFNNTNTVANPSLNVNNTGAVVIVHNGNRLSANSLVANGVYEFVYNGSHWALVGNLGVQVVDNLESTSVTEALSANQGNLLSERITENSEAISNLNTLVGDTAVSEQINNAIAEIPEGFSGSWNDLTDKPFGEVEGKKYLVEETAIKIGEYMGGTEAYPDTAYLFDDFVEGQVYYAVLDGMVSSGTYNAEEECIIFEGIDIEVYYYDSSKVTVSTYMSDPRKGETHTFAMYTIENVTAQLDEQYIPDTIARTPKLATVTLPASSWTGSANPWSQIVTMNGATANSKVDLQPTAIQIVELQNNDIALIAENNDGVVTVYAIGGKPTKDYTMQALITEVTVV